MLNSLLTHSPRNTDIAAVSHHQGLARCHAPGAGRGHGRLAHRSACRACAARDQRQCQFSYDLPDLLNDAAMPAGPGGSLAVLSMLYCLCYFHVVQWYVSDDLASCAATSSCLVSKLQVNSLKGGLFVYFRLQCQLNLLLSSSAYVSIIPLS